MSTSAVIPPATSQLERPGAERGNLARRLPHLTARARALLTAVNLHYAGVVALTVLVLYLAAHLLFLSQSLSATDADAQAQQRTTLRAAQIAAQPLRGIDGKIQMSTTQSDEFYTARLPYEYSQVLTELGALKTRTGVKLNRVQYTAQPELSGPGALTEVRMDASLSGEYRPLVQFINSLERDRMFFVITGITFTGAQGGQVNLRMRLTTYLRQPVGEEPAVALPPAGDTAPPAPATATTTPAGAAQP